METLKQLLKKREGAIEYKPSFAEEYRQLIDHREPDYKSAIMRVLIIGGTAYAFYLLSLFQH